MPVLPSLDSDIEAGLSIQLYSAHCNVYSSPKNRFVQHIGYALGGLLSKTKLLQLSECITRSLDAVVKKN